MTEESWVPPHILEVAEDKCGFLHILVTENILGFPQYSINGRRFGFSPIS
jgi:hypothetical protein